tara:strand:+ start:557 stop:724 length:168 start_codon:yes stop_codon:yes gene_type:complete
MGGLEKTTSADKKFSPVNPVSGAIVDALPNEEMTKMKTFISHYLSTVVSTTLKSV